ncbi:WbqC family protein [Streptomyces sp. NBC_01275]|uniref:WbqC family protein n=1 Tax=Streptomyces sp. NBC_01275 TaxID=2903807 RepID=UPI00224D9DD7|nr:WbqC family protein [Streptomyces sp. NBC_01275]MCX4764138.1 WbqC family protein [Streptomyces sp. NBC_01275]
MCAIHQPNLFPRLSTLAKLLAADRWIVLDDVQFARRDYQHRARLSALDDPDRQQWLTLSTHLPHGRGTLIRDAVLAEPERCRKRLAGLIRQHYGRSRHWHVVRDVLLSVLDEFDTTGRLADVTEASTRALLRALGWNGEVLRSSALPSRAGRSERLADLAALTGSTHYLCGTGGLRYVEHGPFDAHGISVVPFHTPVDNRISVWRGARRISALWALASIGPEELVSQAASQPEEALELLAPVPLPGSDYRRRADA